MRLARWLSQENTITEQCNKKYKRGRLGTHGHPHCKWLSSRETEVVQATMEEWWDMSLGGGVGGIHSKMNYWVIVVSFIVSLTQPTITWGDNLSKGLLYCTDLWRVVLIMFTETRKPTCGWPRHGFETWTEWVKKGIIEIYLSTHLWKALSVTASRSLTVLSLINALVFFLVHPISFSLELYFNISWLQSPPLPHIITRWDIP